VGRGLTGGKKGGKKERIGKGIITHKKRKEKKNKIKRKYRRFLSVGKKGGQTRGENLSERSAETPGEYRKGDFCQRSCR